MSISPGITVIPATSSTRAAAGQSVEVAGSELILAVQDNGVGLPTGGRRSGLRNLEERATALGGGFDVISLETGGTRLCWSVPL